MLLPKRSLLLLLPLVPTHAMRCCGGDEQGVMIMRIQREDGRCKIIEHPDQYTISIASTMYSCLYVRHTVILR
jgi:hypothetical protein